MGDRFKGTSAEQDSRFADKQKKLLKSMKFPEEYSKKVHMSKVNLDILKPWISDKVTEMLGLEDEILIGYLFGLLEAENNPDPRLLEINMTEFLGNDASTLVLDIWKMLLSAQENVAGIPSQLLDAKKEQIRARKAESEAISSKISQKREREEEDAESLKKNRTEERRSVEKDERRRESRDDYKRRDERDYDRRDGRDRDRDYRRDERDYDRRDRRDRDYRRDERRDDRDRRDRRDDYPREDSTRGDRGGDYHRDRDRRREDRRDERRRSEHKDEEVSGERRKRHEALEESPPRESFKSDSRLSIEQLREKALESVKRNED